MEEPEPMQNSGFQLTFGVEVEFVFIFHEKLILAELLSYCEGLPHKPNGEFREGYEHIGWLEKAIRKTLTDQERRDMCYVPPEYANTRTRYNSWGVRLNWGAHDNRDEAFAADPRMQPRIYMSEPLHVAREVLRSRVQNDALEYWDPAYRNDIQIDMHYGKGKRTDFTNWHLTPELVVEAYQPEVLEAYLAKYKRCLKRDGPELGQIRQRPHEVDSGEAPDYDHPAKRIKGTQEPPGTQSPGFHGLDGSMNSFATGSMWLGTFSEKQRRANATFEALNIIETNTSLSCLHQHSIISGSSFPSIRDSEGNISPCRNASASPSRQLPNQLFRSDLPVLEPTMPGDTANLRPPLQPLAVADRYEDVDWDAFRRPITLPSTWRLYPPSSSPENTAEQQGSNAPTLPQILVSSFETNNSDQENISPKNRTCLPQPLPVSPQIDSPFAGDRPPTPMTPQSKPSFSIYVSPSADPSPAGDDELHSQPASSALRPILSNRVKTTLMEPYHRGVLAPYFSDSPLLPHPLESYSQGTPSGPVPRMRPVPHQPQQPQQQQQQQRPEVPFSERFGSMNPIGSNSEEMQQQEDVSEVSLSPHSSKLSEYMGRVPDVSEWDSFGMELVSRVLFPCPESFAEITSLCMRLKGHPCSLHGATESPKTGLHVHVKPFLDKFNMLTLQHLLYILVMYEDAIHTLHIPRRRPKSGSDTALNELSSNKINFEPVEGGFYSLAHIRRQIFRPGLSFDDVNALSGGERQQIVNFTNVESRPQTANKPPTIEFRQHESVLRGEMIEHWVLFCLALVRMANYMAYTVTYPSATGNVNGEEYWVSEWHDCMTVWDLFDRMELPDETREYFVRRSAYLEGFYGDHGETGLGRRGGGPLPWQRGWGEKEEEEDEESEMEQLSAEIEEELVSWELEHGNLFSSDREGE